jgi:LysR family hydrogen peroxide-inducible transcriptional activator
MLARARDALAALSAVTEAAQAARAPMSGRLRLGIIPTLGPFLLPRLMPALRTAFPNLMLLLMEDVTDRLVAGLLHNRLDVAILALPCACAGADTLAVARDAFRVALPPNHRLAARPEIPLATLRAEKLLLLEDGHCLRDQALEACGFARGEQPADDMNGFAATSLHTLVQMVAGGLGVTLLPQTAIAAGIAEGTGIALRPLAAPGASRTIGLTWRPKAPRAADFRALAPVLADVVK